MSSDAKRQVGIKTRAVKRLAADVRSYIAEKATHEARYASASAAGSGVEAHDVRRARDFVDEAEATLRDVRQRLQENFVALQRFLGELAVAPEHAALMNDPCIGEARAMLDEVAPLVSQAEAAAVGEEVRAVRVCVLGDSSINEDDAMWRTSELLGEALARGGFHVVTGGYAGTSEAVAFGASRQHAAGAAAAAAAAPAAAGSTSITGVVCESAFANTLRAGAAGPNQYLTEQLPASDLLDRANLMLRNSDAVIVLPGGLGTLTKLAMAWNVAAVDSWASGEPSASARPVLAWRDPWEALLTSVADTLRIPEEIRMAINFVGSVEDVLAQLEPLRNKAGGAKSENREPTPS